MAPTVVASFQVPESSVLYTGDNSSITLEISSETSRTMASSSSLSDQIYTSWKLYQNTSGLTDAYTSTQPLKKSLISWTTAYSHDCYGSATTAAWIDSWSNSDYECNLRYDRWRTVRSEAGIWTVNGSLTRMLSPEERIRSIIGSRQSPAIHIPKDKHCIAPTKDIREIRARQTLERVLGQDDYRRYLRQGFISVQAKSGNVYQIFPGHGITQVYRSGQMVERLCVVLSGNFPPTDSVIMRYLLILNDEEAFRKTAIKHQIIRSERKTFAAPDSRSLADIFREIKGRSAA